MLQFVDFWPSLSFCLVWLPFGLSFRRSSPEPFPFLLLASPQCVSILKWSFHLIPTPLSLWQIGLRVSLIRRFLSLITPPRLLSLIKTTKLLLPLIFTFPPIILCPHSSILTFTVFVLPSLFHYIPGSFIATWTSEAFPSLCSIPSLWSRSPSWQDLSTILKSNSISIKICAHSYVIMTQKWIDPVCDRGSGWMLA